LYIESGLLFCNAPHIVIVLTTVMIAIVVAICCSKKHIPFTAILRRAITIEREMKERSLEKYQK
jgi:hypothetical protein